MRVGRGHRGRGLPGGPQARLEAPHRLRPRDRGEALLRADHQLHARGAARHVRRRRRQLPAAPDRPGPLRGSRPRGAGRRRRRRPASPRPRSRAGRPNRLRLRSQNRRKGVWFHVTEPATLAQMEASSGIAVSQGSQFRTKRATDLACRQFGAIARRQLLRLGLSQTVIRGWMRPRSPLSLASQASTPTDARTSALRESTLRPSSTQDTARPWPDSRPSGGGTPRPPPQPDPHRRARGRGFTPRTFTSATRER